MQRRKKNVKDEAYIGKYLSYKGKTYTLVPELCERMCTDCDLYYQACPTEITKFCTKGFILKKLCNGRRAQE